MKVLNLFTKATAAFLFSTAFLSALDVTPCKSYCIHSPEQCLNIIRGTVGLNTLCVDDEGAPIGCLEDGPSSTASILRPSSCANFTISPVAALAPNFVEKLRDIPLFTYQFAPYTGATFFTRVYQFEFDVRFNCVYSEAPTVLVSFESAVNGDSLFNFTAPPGLPAAKTSGNAKTTAQASTGFAYVANIDVSSSDVTTTGFRAHATIYLAGTSSFNPSKDVIYLSSPEMDELIESFAGNTRINFEVLGNLSN